MLPTTAEKLQNFFGVFLQFQIGVDRPGTDQLLSLAVEELHQIHRGGAELLLIGKIDIGHLLHLFSLSYISA